MAALPGILGRLRPLNARLLMNYYEGFSCCELAERHGLSLESVRVRIHRSRQRVRSLYKRLATRDSGELRDAGSSSQFGLTTRPQTEEE